MDPSIVSGHLVAAGTALAGLILVFLGQVFTAYDGYDATEQKAVNSKYQWRAVLALLGFILATIAAGFGFWASWNGMPGLVWAGTLSLTGSFIFVVIVAVISVIDLFR